MPSSLSGEQPAFNRFGAGSTPADGTGDTCGWSSGVGPGLPSQRGEFDSRTALRIFRCAEVARQSLKLSKTVRIRPPDPSFGRARESRIDSESIARRFDSFRPNQCTPRLTGVGIRLLSGQKAGFDSQGVRQELQRSAALVSASDCKSEKARLDSAADLQWRCRLMVGRSILNRETAGSIPPSVTVPFG